MKVRYLGQKPSFPIYLPVGANTRGTIKQTVFATPCAELKEDDAVKLVQRFPDHFEFADGMEIHEDKPPVKKGRPRKG